jgi:hypothetical protein
MLIGIVVGTYSLFIATPVLVDTISRDKIDWKTTSRKLIFISHNFKRGPTWLGLFSLMPQ